MRRRDSSASHSRRSSTDRVTGEGPAFHKFGGRVLYARFDLEAWSEGAAPADPDGHLADGARPSS